MLVASKPHSRCPGNAMKSSLITRASKAHCSLAKSRPETVRHAPTPDTARPFLLNSDSRADAESAAHTILFVVYSQFQAATASQRRKSP